MRISLILCAALLLAAPARAAEFVVPVTYTWIADACGDWNCAKGALALAEGDRYVIALPTSDAEWPWMVLRRVAAGSVYLPPDHPVSVEGFDSIAEAAARFASIEQSRAPILVTSMGTRMLVLSLTRTPGRVRAVRR